MFLFKKIVSRFFFPLTVVDFLLIFGVCCLWSEKRTNLGKILVTCGTVLLVLLGYGVLTNPLLQPLEQWHPPLVVENGRAVNGPADVDASRWIIVLSGGGALKPGLPVTGQLSSETVVRVVEGISLYRRLPGTRLLLSGNRPEATLMTQLAIDLGVPKDHLVVEAQGWDTKDQARNIRSIIHDEPAILVTSASHMPRSIALFRGQGMLPIPAPTGHLASTRTGLSRDDLFPQAKNVMKCERAVYEYLGLAWAWLRGQI